MVFPKTTPNDAPLRTVSYTHLDVYKRQVLARGRATINATVRAKFLAMALGGIKTKSTVVRKLRDSEGNLTGKDELQVSARELAPNLQAMSVWLYHHDEDWRKIERKQDEDADIPTDIELSLIHI